MPEVFLQPTLGKPGWFPSIEDKLLDVLESQEVRKEGVKVIGVDPFCLRGAALRDSQDARVCCRTGVANWHDLLPLAVGEEDYLSE